MSVSSVSGTTTPSVSSAGNATGDILRITGMASGLDVDSIVNSMMMPYQNNIDKVQQDMQTIQWKQQAYGKIIDDVKSFQDTYFNVTNSDTNITSSNFFNAINAVSGDSNSVAVTANSSAITGNYSIKVNSLATNASISGSALDAEVSVNDFNKWVTGADGNSGNITFNVAGTSKTITLDPFSVTGDNAVDGQTLVNNINKQLSQDSSLSGKISASYVSDSTGTHIKFNNTSGGSVQITGSNISDVNSNAAANTTLTSPISVVSASSNTKLSDLGFSGTEALNFKYNNTNYSVTVSDSETLSTLASDISKATSGQVTAGLDDLTGKFTLNTLATGSRTTLQITNANPSSDNLLKALKIQPDSNGNITAQGQDANITMTQSGGTQETFSESSNNFSLNGLNITLKNTTTSSINISVSSDVDSVFNKFKTFMDKYNGLVKEIGSKVNEDVVFGYPPLTSAQKSSMSTTDIDNWNTKAQQGLLHNDDNLSNILSGLKSSFYDAIKGITSSFGTSKLGVDFSSDLTQDGTLVFTDNTGDAFKSALQNHSTDVINLFTKQADSSLTGTDKYNNEGIFQRINDIVVNNVDMVGIDKSTKCILGAMAYKQDDYSNTGAFGSGTFLDQLYQDNVRLTDLQSKYSDKKNQYYEQFSNLETALNQLNSQSASLIQEMSK